MNTHNPGEEKRLYTRFKKRVPASIHYNGHCISRCFTLNISIGGALLGVQDLGLTQNSLVEFTFSVNQWHSLYEVRIPAIVVWRDDIQLALSFETIRKDAEELMQDHIESILAEHPANNNGSPGVVD
jgi:hypothetical protein